MGTNIKALATLALTFLEQVPKKGNWQPGDRVPLYWEYTKDAPEWLKKLCRYAHEKNDLLPNDRSFEVIHDSLERMATVPEGTTSMELRNQVGGMPRHWIGQEDIDYHSLAGWWSSAEWRNEYATNAIATGKPHRTITDILQHAQRIEYSKVFGLLLTELNRLCNLDTLE